jgi:hypothetical protein
MDIVYYGINAGETRPMWQPLRRIPLAKQAEVSRMLEDLQYHGVIEKPKSLCHLPSFSFRRTGTYVSF